MTGRSLATPWAPRARGYTLPGSLVIKLALGEAPDAIPSRLDVSRGRSAAATRIDGGAVDRMIREHAGGGRVTRVHAAAASLGTVGRRNQRYDDVEHVSGMSRTFRIDVDRRAPIAALVDALSQLSTVENASPQYVCTIPFDAPTAPQSREDGWAPRELVHAPEAAAYEPGDAAVIIGVVDSGVAAQHEELTDRLRAGFDTVQLGATDLAVGLELLGDRTRMDAKPIDNFVGHGMGCAGIIGALGLGMPPGLAGVCPILPMRVLGAAKVPGKQDAVGIGAIADIDCGMKMAVDLGAKVINMSFGTADSALDAHAPKPHRDVVSYALMRGCVLVAASGNSGAEEVYWPAGFDGVITVGAVDADGRVSSFSTRGAHVALCAPGERVLTAALIGHQLATGTSFAAPFVTAAAALLVSRAARRSHPLDGPRVRELLTTTATPFSAHDVRGCGAGVLDAYAALQELDRTIDRSTPEDSDTNE